MKKILIKKRFSEELYIKNKKLWESSSNAYIELEQMTSEELSYLCKALIEKIPDPFSFLILSEIVEDEYLPLDLVREVFIKGDISCKVAVCLRNNLNEELSILCANSTEEIVKEHFNQKKDV